ncbi:DinB family protein [Mucilaginibacter ginsenosidivorans]|uniref:DinB family protein n=1 Tax=Mucilaginibacter ginsenosidivorans TaxID=398053 RepID=UPI001651F40D|nr:DinB family protein [Mucilaginibacter ginsenosidivorans]
MQDARLTTILSLKNLTVAELHWQYKTGWNTIGALLSHMVAIENYFRVEFVEGRKLTDEETQKWLPAMDMGKYLPQLITGQAVEHYVAELSRSREMMLASLANVTHDDLTRRINDYDAETGCNLAWVLYHMVEDEIYHRGQISIIRKFYRDMGGV